MSKGNIMLCLLRLDIGGLETYVLNQTKELIARGYNVVILAKYGIYKDKFISLGATCINFEFSLINYYDIERAKKIEELIKKYKIDQVHIHQLDCITSAFLACVNTNTPYVAYAHTGVRGIYDWFEKTFPGYDKIFKLYFNKAQKIVAITDEAVDENKSKYEVDEKKYIIVHNSIDFNEIEENIIPKKIENFIIISRLAEQKEISLKSSIQIFKEYLKENKNAKLTIVGDGNIRELIEQEIQDIKENSKMLGARNDVMDIIKQNDVVIATDRCILEAVASKKIAIISGYEGNKNIVIPENVEKAADLNFSGRNLENKSASEIIEFLKSLNEGKIEEIVNKNYEFAVQNLNIKNNVFVLEPDIANIDYKIDKEFYFEVFNSIILKLEEERKKNLEIYNTKQKNEEQFLKNIKELENKKQELEEEIQNLKKENDALKEKNKAKEKELDMIYNSKRWRYVEKAKNVINKFKGKK